MAHSTPHVLIIGHSFVRRLKSDLRVQFDERASKNFGLCGSAVVHMHGVGGRTVAKLRKHDLGVVSSLCPDIVILEIGTNDLALSKPEVVGFFTCNLFLTFFEVLSRHLLMVGLVLTLIG